MISINRCPANMKKKKKQANKIFVHDSIIPQCKWLSLSRKMVEIQKFCHHGNLTSHFSLLSDLVFRVEMQILMEQWLGLC